MSMPTRDTILRMPQVVQITGLSRAFVYRLIERQDFPRPVQMGRARGWRESDIARWIADRPAAPIGAGKKKPRGGRS